MHLSSWQVRRAQTLQFCTPPVYDVCMMFSLFFSSRFRTFNAFNCVDFRTILIFLTGKHCLYALNSVSERYKVAPLQNVEVVNMATKSGDVRPL